MAARLALFAASLLLLLLAPAAAYAQNSMDISLPASYHINTTRAYDTYNFAVSVGGDISFLRSDNDVYAAIPTDAPDGATLAFFQDTESWALFRNNTLLLPIFDGQGRIASLILTTDNVTSANGSFYGRITGIEIDTKGLEEGDALAGAVLYLSRWPDNTSYPIAVSDDAKVKKAVLDEATREGQAGNVKLMLDIKGDSIGYAIVRMKAPEAAGNVSAYRYSEGVVSKPTCKEIRSGGSVVYETICSGGGTFAFVGPFPEPPPAMASLQDVLLFSGIIGTGLLFIVGTTIIALKMLIKNELHTRF